MCNFLEVFLNKSVLLLPFFVLPMGWLRCSREAIIDHKGGPYVSKTAKNVIEDACFHTSPETCFQLREKENDLLN